MSKCHYKKEEQKDTNISTEKDKSVEDSKIAKTGNKNRLSGQYIWALLFVFSYFIALFVGTYFDMLEVTIVTAFVSFSGAVFYGPLPIFKSKNTTESIKSFLKVVVIGGAIGLGYVFLLNLNVLSYFGLSIENHWLLRIFTKERIGNIFTSLSLLLLFIDKINNSTSLPEEKKMY